MSDLQGCQDDKCRGKSTAALHALKLAKAREEDKK